MPQRNILKALFDVQPKDASGLVDVEKVSNLSHAIDLRPKKIPQATLAVAPVEPVVPRESAVNQLIDNQPVATHQDIIAHEVETALAEMNTQEAIVAVAEPTPAIAEEVSQLEQFWVQPERVSPAAREVEVWLDRMKKKKPLARQKVLNKKHVLIAVLIMFLAGGGFAVANVVSGAGGAKQSILQNGTDALADLEVAKSSLKELQFDKAADNFKSAYDNFNNASGTLNKFGASFLSLFGNFPGFRSVSSANRLVQAGKNISKAGENLSRAVNSLSKTNVFSLLHTDSQGGSGAKPVSAFQAGLLSAQDSIKQANELLDKVDQNSIPEDKRSLFADFKRKIPDFQALIGTAVAYSDSLLKIVGPKSPRTYMVLLENNSERRPSGGFPGTYAIISFDKGELKNLLVDDIYNPDGQIKMNIIPPAPLAHITPNWGMRDANWFADFPTTAKKISEMYSLDGGAKLDGVFAVTPTVIARLLTITGPIEVPEYRVTLGADNFLAEIQDEVETKGDRSQPKKIVTDFQPKFFSALAGLDKDRWFSVMRILLDAGQEKHAMAYFADGGLEKEAIAKGIGGEIKSYDGDYLQVAFSNVKGGKADAVTANSMKLAVDGTSRALTITRAHNGGDSKYAFYNKELPAYVKVYVTQGAVIDKIDGISHPNYKPLVNYSDLGFKEDEDIADINKTMTHPMQDVDVFEESGKTVFGFWMITKPRKTSSVTVTYHVPVSTSGRYTLYWQKQSGTEHDMIHVGVAGTSAVYDSDLSLDRKVNIVVN